MSIQDAVESLKRLGLSNYEAQVFVALTKLGEGTAQDVSDESDVPRSQVYGAADDLADRGLVEPVQSSPKRYRPVDLETARTQLRERIDNETDRAFETLSTIQADRADRSTVELATLRGHHPVGDRAASLIEGATDRVIYVCATEALLSEAVERALRDRGEAGIPVFVATSDSAVQDRLADTPVRTFYLSMEEAGGFTGRSLLIDEATVLLSSVEENDGLDEMAMWTDGSRIGEILARFIENGMENNFDLGG